jgi:hypothetical protein
MLTWFRRRVRSDLAAEEARAVRLVHEVFGPGVTDVTPAIEGRRSVIETAA